MIDRAKLKQIWYFQMDSQSPNWLNDAIFIDIGIIIIFQIWDNEPQVMSFSIPQNEYKVSGQLFSPFVTYVM